MTSGSTFRRAVMLRLMLPPIRDVGNKRLEPRHNLNGLVDVFLPGKAGKRP